MENRDFYAAKPFKEIASPDDLKGIMVIPERIDDQGIGYYDEFAADIYRELKKIEPMTAYFTNDRTTIHRFSSGEEYLIGFCLGIASNFAYDVIKTLIKLKSKKNSKSRVKGEVYISSKPDKTWQSYKIEGSVDEALKMIDKIQAIHNDKSSTRNEKTK